MVVNQAKDSIQRRKTGGSESRRIRVEANSVNRGAARLRDGLFESRGGFLMTMELNFRVPALSRRQINGHRIFVVTRGVGRGDHKSSGDSRQPTFSRFVRRRRAETRGDRRAGNRRVLVGVCDMR